MRDDASNSPTFTSSARSRMQVVANSMRVFDVRRSNRSAVIPERLLCVELRRQKSANHFARLSRGFVLSAQEMIALVKPLMIHTLPSAAESPALSLRGKLYLLGNGCGEEPTMQPMNFA